ncbi:CCA tRNA nucleotidyltransferase [Colletotrichum tropicale]|nr:CCA tRNA nucleotidyltransferase [Colletotrichum tropicale]
MAAAATTIGTPVLQLTAKEEQLKELLVEVAASIDRTCRPSDPPLVLRWAGGWVRDKLLGIESHDIDTAINVMTGYTFSQKMRDYCDDSENRRKHNISPDDLGSIHKIAANPDKSKHLETATSRIFGLDVDFVNLRKETYTQDSRNPIMEFGTAEEDAMRRDATINALFYNLHTGLIEDLTGGLKDMASRLIRTPMSPLQTFTDDPLRVLRLVRFASRLDFDIDPAATAVMAEPSVLGALKLKISRERVGVEVEKMLKGRHPRKALELIHNLGLYEAIFTDPSGEQCPAPDLSKWKLAYGCLDLLFRDRVPGSIYNTLIATDEAAYLAWALAAVIPYSHVKDEVAFPKSKGTIPVTTLVAREGIKGPNKLCDMITGASRHCRQITAMKDNVCAKNPPFSQRDIVGMAVRNWDAQGGHWQTQIVYAILVEATDKLESLSDSDVSGFLTGWKCFLDHLADLDVMDAPSLRRLVDGRLLTKELGVRPVTYLSQAQPYLKGGAMLRTLVAQLQQPNAAIQFKLAQVLPQRYTLFDIANGLSECQTLPERRVIEGVSLCLKQTDRIERRSVDAEDAARLANYATMLLERTPDGLPLCYPSSDNAAPVDDVLGVLLSLVVHHSLCLDDDILLAVAAYADGHEDWSAPTTASIAKDLLDHALSVGHRKTAFITSVVLERFIRPIFSRYSSSRLTSAGRQAYYRGDDHDQVTGSALSSGTDTKPWKSTQSHAVTVFAWTVEQSDEHIIATKWPLFVPVILCLIDDTDTAYKARGLAILQEFLERSTASMLRATGLGEIFEQSIFPSLMSLPTLTHEDESIQLLVPAYGAVIRLADVQFPDPSTGSQKNRFLSRLLREAILAGYWHASDYAGIVEVLTRQVSSVVRRLGAFTIPHVKGLLSMLTTILSDPFIVTRPECVQAASQALY